MNMKATKERPILFSGPMVRAILDGSKTQTRRVVKPQPLSAGPVPCPYGKIGHRLWVRETHRYGVHDDLWDAVEYKADGAWMKPSGLDQSTGWKFSQECDSDTHRWRSPIFMPRWASRILLEVTDVRVERVQEISEADVLAEGVDYENGETAEWFDEGEHYYIAGSPHTGEKYAFMCLWDSINAKTYPWDSNPWVWAVSFKRVEESL
jgi:hypothetical protein